MVVESSGCVHAALRVGGRPVLVWSIVGLDWMGLGKATLIHAPAAAWKLLRPAEEAPAAEGEEREEEEAVEAGDEATRTADPPSPRPEAE